MLLYGVTLITHGFNSGADTWVDAMGDAVKERIADEYFAETGEAGAVAEYRLEIWNEGGPLSVNQDPNRTGYVDGGPVWGDASTGEVVIRLDWSAIDSVLDGTYNTSKVAEVVSNWFVDSHHEFIEAPLHLIGHSRGASLVGALVADFAEAGIWVDHATFLDTHPILLDYGDNSENGGDFDITNNVRFADSYYREGQPTAPNGEEVLGAFNVYFGKEDYLSDSVLRGGYGGATDDHADVHLWYQGTIDTTGDVTDVIDGEGATVEEAFAATWWYNPNNRDDDASGPLTARDETGYFYSRIEGGTLPAVGLASSPDRINLARSGTQWPNLEATLEIGGGAMVEQGANIPLVYAYQSVTTATLSFGYDNDQNPNNGGNVVVGATTKSRTSDGRLFDNGLAGIQNLDSSQIPLGSHFLFARIAANGYERYVYTQSRVQITEPIKADVDLLGTFFDIPLGQAAPGQQIAVTYRIHNDGDASAGPFAVQWHISRDSTIETSDPELSRTVFGALGGGDSTGAIEKDVTLPEECDPFWNGDGTYYIGMIIDPEKIVSESTKTNNSNRGDGLDRDSVQIINSCPLPPSILYIDDDFTSETPGWGVDHFDVVQDAIDASENGNTIIVSQGTYSENIDFRGKSITVRSTNPLNESVVLETIIDGGGNGSVVTFKNGEDSNAVLSGFTIRNGVAEYGGGVFVRDATPQIANNVIMSNKSTKTGGAYEGGGGIYITGGADGTIIENNVLRNNIAANFGGGMLVVNASPRVARNTFEDNRARGGAGARFAVSSAALITENVFRKNEAISWAGGVYIDGNSPVTLLNNLIVANSSGAFAGGIYVVLSSPTITNNTIVGNTVDPDFNGGGGILLFLSSPTITNNTIVGNVGHFFASISKDNESSPLVRNNIIWNNPGDVFSINFANSSCVEDPRFIDPGSWENGTWVEGDYHLLPGSPCIDTADGGAAPETDADGNPRHDDPGTPNTGAGTPTYIDIGAFEFQGETQLDFGDAPDSYSTTVANNGARHLTGSGPFLGTLVDDDPDGQPNASATGDDTDSSGDDDDGVQFASTPLALGKEETVNVVASAAGLLNAWIDFNNNGTWADPGEQVFTDKALVAGENSLVFTVPNKATASDQTFARFRFSTQGGLPYNGPAPDGEVEDYEISIVPGNHAPTLGDIGDQTVDELSELTFTATASDEDVPAQNLTFSLDKGGPSGASVEPNSGVFSWTPSEGQGPGTYAITIRVTDDGSPNLNDFETIEVTVGDVNKAPVLASIGNKSVDEGSLLTFTGGGTDPDMPQNALTFSLGQDAPAGASIDAMTGEFRWTPTEAQGPGKYPVTVIVTDDGTPNLNDFETIEITVLEANGPPVLGAIGDKPVNEGDLLTFTASASDTDLPANTLTFSLAADAPLGASIDANSGVFTWTPTEAQGPGTHTVTVRVSDDGTPKLDDFETITIVVAEVNAAPVLTTIGDKPVNEGSLLTFTASANDSDTPANGLTYSLDAGAPAGASIDAMTGVLRWTPTEAQGPGTFDITVRVTDDGTPKLNDFEAIAITVKEVNNPPSKINLSTASAKENVPGAVIGELTVEDADVGDSHTLSIDNDERFVVDGNQLRLVKGQSLVYDDNDPIVVVRVIATDSGGLSHTEPLALTALPNPLPYRNEANPLDSTGDGYIVPRDVLVIINEIEEHGPHALRLPPPIPIIYFYDTNGDGYISPIDVLLVINYLEAFGEDTAEGEALTDSVTTLATRSLSGNEPFKPSFFNDRHRNTRQFDRERAFVIGPQREPSKSIAPEFWQITERTRDKVFGQIIDDSNTLRAVQDDLETVLDELTRDFL